MIRDFWVKNYLSIRDKQGLSFLAKGPASELVAEVSEGVFLYKLGIVCERGRRKGLVWRRRTHLRSGRRRSGARSAKNAL